MIFLSTLSLRRATILLLSDCITTQISIHALLAESDTLILFLAFMPYDFYPRSPCGERPLPALLICPPRDFYPRSPCGERPLGPSRLAPGAYFYPRSPCGERPVMADPLMCNLYFYPRSPCGERQAIYPSSTPPKEYFYPRSPCGERPRTPTTVETLICISIHALLAESDSKSAQNSGALLRIWNKFYGDCIFMLTGKAVFYPFCPCFFHIFWCEGSGNFMIAFPSH